MQTVILMVIFAGLLSEEHAAPHTIPVASGLPDVIGADDETAQTESKSCNSSILLPCSQHHP
jgi:hypothetical protein